MRQLSVLAYLAAILMHLLISSLPRLIEVAPTDGECSPHTPLRGGSETSAPRARLSDLKRSKLIMTIPFPFCTEGFHRTYGKTAQVA